MVDWCIHPYPAATLVM